MIQMITLHMKQGHVGRQTTNVSADTLPTKGEEKIAIPAMIQTMTLNVKQGIKGKDS